VPKIGKFECGAKWRFAAFLQSLETVVPYRSQQQLQCVRQQHTKASKIFQNWREKYNPARKIGVKN
jgi:hypothetical protein